ncbi:MAG TPA: hypothetical protein VHK65_18465 [Candidatus Dormibacteraeota bacterium]|nr:hypothetical protein [Candidatus Dormibacteraeota bacterium]
MAIDTEIEEVAGLRPEPNGAGASPPEAVQVVTPAVAPEGAADHAVSEKPLRAQRRRGWVPPVAIGVAALIVSGTLTGFLWSTIGQRDTAQHQLAVTQATLTTTRDQLTAAHADAARQKMTSDYITFVAVNNGRALTNYQTMAACASFGPCRTAAQQTLTDLQAFQTQRAAANVPPALSNADGELRDGLSAAIAALQEFITGADNDDVNKVKDGAHKLDAAFLTIGKAEADLGTASS